MEIEESSAKKAGRPKTDDHRKVLSVTIPSWQKQWLNDHCVISGNKTSEIIETLLDFYIYESYNEKEGDKNGND